MSVALSFELGPPKSYQLILESKLVFVPNLKAFLKYRVQENGIDGLTTKNIMPLAMAVTNAEAYIF